MTLQDRKEKLVSLLRRHIAAEHGEKEFSRRQAIYSHFRQRVQQGAEEGRYPPHALQFLSEAIVEIEHDMAPFQGDFAGHAAEQTAKLDETSNQEYRSGHASNLRPGFGPTAWTVIGLVLAACIASLGYFWMDRFGGLADETIHRADIAKVLTTDEEPLATVPTSATNITIANTEGAPAIHIKGPANLFANEKFPIDLTRSYEIGVRLRVLPKADGSATKTKMYVGLATYDKDGNVETSSPGSHRYGVMRNETISSDQGWIERTAVFKGAGDQDSTQFRSGTATARVVVVANRNSDPDAEVDISTLTWRLLPR